jgi:hypothetical protein
MGVAVRGMRILLASPLEPNVFRVLGSEARLSSRIRLYFPDKNSLLPGGTF